MNENVFENVDHKLVANYVITRVFGNKQTAAELLKDEITRVTSSPVPVDWKGTTEIYYKQ